jgi:hypothetical protein
MSQVTPSKVLAEVSAAVPAACRENIVIIGSLAAGYHFFGDDESKAVRTKDVDCVLEPFHAAVGAGQSIARQLLDAGWQRRMKGDHQNPGNEETPVDQLPAVRLYPPEANPDSEEAWFIELLTVPESAAGSGKEWTRIPLAEGDRCQHSCPDHHANWTCRESGDWFEGTLGDRAEGGLSSPPHGNTNGGWVFQPPVWNRRRTGITALFSSRAVLRFSRVASFPSSRAEAVDGPR